ncbi:MAG: hypothetical protein GEU83_10950 [Pseudonocardiaceae bacterium]|nr:hypothetical protein [Pseudonocardiaceae bacterium]
MTSFSCSAVDEVAPQVVPGSGRLTVTKRIVGLTPGEWNVTATPVAGERTAGRARPMPARASSSGSTGFAPVIQVRAPGVRIGTWPALVGLGAAAALTVQALLAARLSLPVTPVLLSLLACLLGLVGAKLYYLAEHPSQPRTLMTMTGGMCIQGFVLAAVGTVVAGALVAGLPIGPLLDITPPRRPRDRSGHRRRCAVTSWLAPVGRAAA